MRSKFLTNTSVFAINMTFCLHAAQFAYRKGLGCSNDALLTMSHHIQKSLDAGMESRTVQLVFSASFNRVSHSGQIIQIEIYWCAVCCQFVESSSPTVGVESLLMVLPVSGSQLFLACHMIVICVLFCSPYTYTSERFEMVENRFNIYADNSTPLAVVRKLAEGLLSISY